MTITYERDVKELADQGLTDEQIAQHLSAKTAMAIQCSEARKLLLESQAIVIDPLTGGRSGPVIDYYLTLDGDSKHLVGWFISHVLDNGEFISTDEHPRSVQLDGVVGDLPVELENVGDALIELGGGNPHAGTTIDDVVQARDLYGSQVAQKQAEEEAAAATIAQRVKFNELTIQFIEPLQTTNDSDDNSWINAIQNMASTWSE